MKAVIINKQLFLASLIFISKFYFQQTIFVFIVTAITLEKNCTKSLIVHTRGGSK